MRAWILGLLAVTLVACGAPRFDSVEQAAYADAVCTTIDGWQRVPDSYCPIGDDDPPPGYPYRWRYRPYRTSDPVVVIPYNGYEVDRTVWVDRRPTNITTINIHRGDFPETAPAGSRATSFNAPPSATAYVPDKKPGSASVTRGGLGSTSAAYTPVESAKAGPPPKRIPPPPVGKRPMAAAKKKK